MSANVQETPAAALSHRRQALAAALRGIAAKGADLSGGGLALLFTTASEASAADPALRLRAAAGFVRAEAAREAAGALLPRVGEVLADESAREFTGGPSLGARAAGAVVIYPLVCEGHLHGALAVGSPGELDGRQREDLAELAELAALRLDHDRLHERLARPASGDGASGEGDEQSEEILKLSEALFAKDIELLRGHEKLGKIEKLKNDFIHKMSRELRTPLNSIIEAIISVLTGENDALSEAAKQTLRSALDDGTSFLRTLQNILDLWRIKQGELPVEIQDVNLREIVDEAIFSIQDVIGDRPVSVEHQLAKPFPKIRTDLTKVNQILLLLLDNAAKFTPRGRIAISARVASGQLVCEVRDTGIGMCPDDQQFAFDEFYQVDDSSSQKYRGAGLGLALVRDLVVVLGGEVSISSEVAVGTAVTFQIPVEVMG